MGEESWWTKGAGAMPPTLPPTSFQRYNNNSSGGGPSGRRVTQAAGSGNWSAPAYKRSRAKTFEDGVEVPAGHNDDGMSEIGSTASGNQRKDQWKNWENRRGREPQYSRQPPQRRGGKGGRFDKTAICDVPNDATHHHWMQMISQGVHQALIQSRKAGGQVYDTWICNAEHSMAIFMLQLAQANLEKAEALRHTRTQARKDSQEPPPHMLNPAAGMMARFVSRMMTHQLGPNAEQQMKEIWAHIGASPNLIEDVSYFSVTAVSEGKETRIAIGMRGWAMRTKLLEVMRQFGPEMRYSPGGAPPGYMERQLGEYCHELKEWNEQ